jgi:RND superfamily putative drug exporter
MTTHAAFTPTDWFTPPRQPSPQLPAAPSDRSRLGRLGRWVARRRIAVLVATAAVLVALAPLAAGAATHLRNGGFTATGADSTRAGAVLAGRFHGGEPNLVLVATAAGPVDDPAAAAAGRALADRVSRDPDVLAVTSYWSAPPTVATPLRSADGRSALVLVRLAGDEDQVRQAAKRLVPHAVGRQGPLEVRATGTAQVSVEIEQRSEADLRRAEALALPVTLLILVLVFGSAVAAMLPLVIGGLSILGTYAVLRLLTFVTPVSIFSLNITTALGLGLAIDYSLFILTRYREELGSRRSVIAAVGETVRTAGRTVLFSALTVALSLSALLVFPLYFLRSFAYAGIAVVLLAAVQSVLVLPALLALAGRRVDALDLRGPLRRLTGRHTAPPNAASESAFWRRIATAVMRRPLVVAVLTVGLLAVLGVPFLHARFGLTDDRVLPASAPAHQAAQELRDGFAARESSAVTVVLPDLPGAGTAALADYAARVSAVPGVTRVDTATGSYTAGRRTVQATPASARFADGHGGWLSVITRTEPYSAAGSRLVADVRAVPAPAPALVGGQAAMLVDTRAELGRRLPLALGIIALTTMVLLFAFTGSVLIPIKAVALNLLSLTATFGAMVYVFADGHLRPLVGDFTVTGLIDITIPVLMFCVAFGLSMDYEVFLLSRIKEEYARTGNNTHAVATGLARTGRLVTAAAVLIATVLLSMATSGLTFLKMLGIGLTLAVIMDATVIRGLLVPAFMRLTGRANWWAPAPLRRLHTHIGLSEH